MCKASSVRSVKFSRRRNPARSGECALAINNGVVVRAIRASNVENAACASSLVMSCIRTLRVVADANSEAARSLTISKGGRARRTASARAVNVSMVNRDTGMLASR
jgi:hypothetical protein